VGEAGARSEALAQSSRISTSPPPRGGRNGGAEQAGSPTVSWPPAGGLSATPPCQGSPLQRSTASSTEQPGRPSRSSLLRATSTWTARRYAPSYDVISLSRPMELLSPPPLLLTSSSDAFPSPGMPPRRKAPAPGAPRAIYMQHTIPAGT